VFQHCGLPWVKNGQLVTGNGLARYYADRSWWRQRRIFFVYHLYHHLRGRDQQHHRADSGLHDIQSSALQWACHDQFRPSYESRIRGQSREQQQFDLLPSEEQRRKFLTLAGPFEGNEQAAFNANNLNYGTDNLFSNQSDPNGNNNNIERVDVVFRKGLLATPALFFSVLERGVTGGHDPFKIAAITSINPQGSPAGYGPLIGVGPGSNFGTYGTTNLVASTLTSCCAIW
jgi:hypothetical protein